MAVNIARVNSIGILAATSPPDNTEDIPAAPDDKAGKKESEAAATKPAPAGEKASSEKKKESGLVITLFNDEDDYEGKIDDEATIGKETENAETYLLSESQSKPSLKRKVRMKHVQIKVFRCGVTEGRIEVGSFTCT